MIFLQFKQIMSFDKTNIHFLINSCELKVHHLFNLLLDSDDHVIKVVERHVDIDYSVLFKNISDIY
jgi:hypothetical protein